MKQFLIFLFVFRLFTLNAQDQSASITFRVISSTLSQGDRIFISGNHKLTGSWQPDKINLTHIVDSVWAVTLKLPVGFSLEYKFTRGTWGTEASRPDGMPLRNLSLDIKEDTIVNHVLNYWRDGAELPVQGKITGQVEYYRQMEGKNILPRDIIVWLPPSYYENKEFHYPVLYMNDGQNIIDPNTSSFKVDWSLDEIADSLIKAGKIDSLIIVGINSTEERGKEYVPGEKGTAYMKFVVGKVKPMIDSIYRTKPDREYTAIGGASLGGLISFMFHWDYNQVFGKAVCMSLAFQYDDFNYITMINNKPIQKKLQVYIYNGDTGLENELQPGNEAMLDALEDMGYIKNKDYYWHHAINARHFEKDWGIGMIDVLKRFFPATN